MKVKTAPSGAPAAERSRCASAKSAPGLKTTAARWPPRFAGESRKTVCGGAIASMVER